MTAASLAAPEHDIAPTPALRAAAARVQGDPDRHDSLSAKTPLRVLFIDYSFGFGGAIRSLKLTLAALDGVEAYVATSQHPSIVGRMSGVARVFRIRHLINYTLKQRVSAALRAQAARMAALKCVALADHLAMAVNTLRLMLIVRRERIALMHLNNGFTPQEALLAARLMRVPCVVHLRDFHGESARVEQRRASAVRHIIAVSDAVARGLAGTVVADCPTTTVHDPVDLAAAEAAAALRDIVRQRYGLAPGDVAIGIFGRVVEWKGQLEFIEAALPVLERCANARVFIVGDESDGGAGYLAKCRERVASSTLAGRFVFTGYRADVDAYFAAMDIVVHASITPEPFGMVVAEAMAAGRAVVAINAGGPAEVITDGADGLLVSPGDWMAMTSAIGLLVQDAHSRSEIGAAARRTIRRRHGTEANAERIAAVYRDVLVTRAQRTTAHDRDAT